MAGSDAQRHLFTLIRDYASEKSVGERRLVGMRQRIDELRSEAETANAELEDAKRTKEIVEQELKGYELESALNEALIQTLQSRVSNIQDEISTVGSDLEALKNKEGASRDEFISHMFDLNAKIRKFQDTIACDIHKESYIGTKAEQNYNNVKEEVAEVTLTTLQDMLAKVISQITKEEEEYLSEQNTQKQMQQELIGCERKVSLMEVISKATGALQDLTRYPYKKEMYQNGTQTFGSLCSFGVSQVMTVLPIGIVSLTINKQISKLEPVCASLGEELQKRCVCTSCHLDNVESLGEVFQAN
ncbi:hypothetical protein FNV43_RR14411 [Rhamnella rubrinervis]|uniref:Uncharacterized protein n=1 Tax=Rhamnella rubrinervis TaxID=2594499 RepID=A0A8K0H394_9ROSA|nr:hypothetical protein FNV43_RR14411 [Rhamnella rubrinervis]